MGKIALVDGDPGIGKSTMLLDIAARVTSNGIMPDGTQGETGSVIILAGEDDLADTIKPRLMSAHADISRIIEVTEMKNGVSSRPIALPRDLKRLGQIVKKTDTKLIIADPLYSFLECDINSDQEVKKAMHVFKKWAKRHNVAVIGLRHMNKASGMKAIYRGSGSIGVLGASRTAMLVGKDPDDDTRSILAMGKTNLGPKPPSQSFSLVPGADEVCRVHWHGMIATSADELVASPVSEEEKGAVSEAVQFLLEKLANGPRLIADLKAEAKELELTDKILRNARTKLKIKGHKIGYGKAWYWALPGQVPVSGASSEATETQHHDGSSTSD